MVEDDVRRSGRATKGQHNAKSREDGPPTSKKGKATKTNKKAKAEAEQDEEEEGEDDAIIRCVCGEYNEDEEGRTMICCDKCEAWQHNDCMGLPDDYSPPSYFCEKCKPANHRELLAAVKRGEKPWAHAAAERDASKKGKKGVKKGGRKSAVQNSEPQRTPTAEPEERSSSRKRKLEDSPAPSAAGRSKKARSSLPDNGETPEVKDEEQEVPEEPAEEPATENEVIESEFMKDVAKDAKSIEDSIRSKIATGLIKSFVDQAKGLSKTGSLTLPQNETSDSLATKVALAVEHALYHVRSGGEGEPNDAYKDHVRSILNNTKSNAGLLLALLHRKLLPEKIAAMNPKDMASDEQKQRDVEEKMRMEKQHVLTEEEKAPRMRKTHKGDEYIDEPAQLSETAPAAPRPVQAEQKSADQDVEMKSPPAVGTTEKPQPMRKPSASAKGKPFGDVRRKSSANFDIDKVWSGVQGSPTDGDAPKLSGGSARSPSLPQNAGNDVDVDRLLKDEENDSEPYSPKDTVEESVVWRGKVTGGSLGTFTAVARFAAGCQPDVDNLRMTWNDILPSEIKLHGRIDPGKADEYLCGLEWSSSSELIIVSIPESKGGNDHKEFTKFFKYLKERGRYGVGSQHTNPAIKDIYMIPLDVGSPLPIVMKALDHQFTDPVQEKMLLIPIVIRWTELPHNAERLRQQQLQQAAQSPSLGPGVTQTPITPREPQFEHTGAVNGGAQPQTQTPMPQAAAKQTLTAPAPAAINAQRVLGPEMAALPAVVDLIKQAPNAGDDEFNIIKECIVENAEAGKSLIVLTQSLHQKYQSQRSAKEQAQAQSQAPAAAPA